MKRPFIILCLLIVFASIAYALSPTIDHKKIPPMALPDAYHFAMVSLGSATNQFHCSGAVFESDEWQFDFFNTNGIPKTVSVSKDGSSRVYDGGPTY